VAGQIARIFPAIGGSRCARSLGPESSAAPCGRRTSGCDGQRRADLRVAVLDPLRLRQWIPGFDARRHGR
jgi:hypothetical protein